MPTVSPAPTAEPTVAPPNTIDLSGSQAKQGGFLIVRLVNTPGLSAAAAYINGTGYYMSYSEASADWYAYIGLDVFLPLGDYALEVWDGNAFVSSTTASIGDGGFTYESFDVPPAVGELLLDQPRIDAEREQVAAIEAGVTPQKYWSGPWIVPTVGETTSNFGAMRSTNGGPYYPHTGVDLANSEGTPIYAAADGMVAFASELYLYGNSIIIDHGVGVFSSYNHMQSFIVTAGQLVSQGDLIGYMGTTGFSTGAHLHWEAIVHGVRIDARLFTLGGAD
jgi:murein DD-endopeptidase MepM/ murein hydrolase activator NlpD